MTNAEIAENNVFEAVNVPLQPSSFDIWDTKHRLKDQSKNPIDENLTGYTGTFGRVAAALAENEKDADKEKEFHWALANGATPAGRILANAGAEAYKPSTSTINCVVSENVEDNIESIGFAIARSLITLKFGSGIGYCFSLLRHAGAPVSGAGAQTGGPLGFMDIFDKGCTVIESAGERRGAQMATFFAHHPDVYDFIQAKREAGRLRQFNLSLLITDELVEAKNNDEDWHLYFPISRRHNEGVSKDKIIYRDWPVHDERYIYDDEGRVACEIVKTVEATHLWRTIMEATYFYSDPGFLLIDRINEMNNNWFCEVITATNPCGEQPLPPNGACLLGSINLPYLVVNPFEENAHFDWVKFKRVVRIFSRMLDNVVEKNNLPLEAQRAEIIRKRRHGMGYLGLGSALALMGMKYGDKEALSFTEEVSKVMAVEGWKVGLELAKEKGAAPIMNEEFEVTAKMLRIRPEMVKDGYKVGDVVLGRILWARYSRYMQRIAEVEPELVNELAERGCRYTHHTSIAPTGTIAFGVGNNVSNGIEPTFSHSHFRNVIKAGKKTKAQVEVQSFELLAYRYLKDSQTDDEINNITQQINVLNDELKQLTEGDIETQVRQKLAEINELKEHRKEWVEVSVKNLPDYCVTARDLSPQDHIYMQAAAQKWIDSSISKTINVPTKISFEDFEDLYQIAYDCGLKGCTTFRFNPEVHAGVMVSEEDLRSKTYKFDLGDGTVVEARGDETVFYDGESHIAANLYDAHLNGQYGKF